LVIEHYYTKFINFIYNVAFPGRGFFGQRKYREVLETSKAVKDADYNKLAQTFVDIKDLMKTRGSTLGNFNSNLK